MNTSPTGKYCKPAIRRRPVDEDGAAILSARGRQVPARFRSLKHRVAPGPESHTFWEFQPPPSPPMIRLPFARCLLACLMVTAGVAASTVAGPRSGRWAHEG